MLIRNAVDYGFSKNIARKFGVPAACILNRIIWSINLHYESRARYANKYFIDDQWWMNDSFKAIHSHFGDIYSLRTINTAVKALEDGGILISKKMESRAGNHTKWYAVNIAEYEKVDNAKIAQSISDNAEIAQSQIMQKLHNPDDAKIAHSSSTNSRTNNHTDSPESAVLAEVSVSLASSKKKKSPKYEDSDLELGQKWLAYAKETMKWKKAYRSWTPEGFAALLMKAREKSGVTPEGMVKLFEFIKNHYFWNDKVLSPSALLKKTADSDELRIDTILLQATKKERKNDKILAIINSESDPF